MLLVRIKWNRLWRPAVHRAQQVCVWDLQYVGEPKKSLPFAESLFWTRHLALRSQILTVSWNGNCHCPKNSRCCYASACPHSPSTDLPFACSYSLWPAAGFPPSHRQGLPVFFVSLPLFLLGLPDLCLAASLAFPGPALLPVEATWKGQGGLPLPRAALSGWWVEVSRKMLQPSLFVVSDSELCSLWFLRAPLRREPHLAVAGTPHWGTVHRLSCRLPLPLPTPCLELPEITSHPDYLHPHPSAGLATPISITSL